jgi:transposase-like protein
METLLTLQEFVGKFSSEDACFEYFVKIRWPKGFRCPVCGHEKYYFLNDKKLFQCKSCGRQTSVTAGTVFHRLRKPLSTLLWAVYLIGTSKKGISGLELQRKLGLSSYKTSWLLIHKIREAMSPKGVFKLANEVEVDETYVGGHHEGKRGRGAEGKTLVAIALETKGKKDMGRSRLKVVSSASKENLLDFIGDHVDKGSVVHTDGFASYGDIDGYRHEPHKKSKDNKQVLPRLHVVVANLKMWLRGTFNRLPQKHLQRYLDEFTFRFNRRMKISSVFGILFSRCLSTHTITYADLKG